MEHKIETSFEFEHYKPVEGKKNYVTFSHTATRGELHTAITDWLKAYPGIDDTIDNCFEMLDYLSYSNVFDTPITNPIPRFRWVYCYVVPGGSEGYYFHIECHPTEGHPETLLIGKTLYENHEKALYINTAINAFILKALRN